MVIELGGLKLKDMHLPDIRGAIRSRLPKREAKPASIIPQVAPASEVAPVETQAATAVQPPEVVSTVEDVPFSPKDNEEWGKKAKPAIALMETAMGREGKLPSKKEGIMAESGGKATSDEVDACVMLRDSYNEAWRIIQDENASQEDNEKMLKPLMFFLEETAVLGSSEPSGPDGLSPQQMAQKALAQLAPAVMVNKIPYSEWKENTKRDAETQTGDKWANLTERERLAARLQVDNGHYNALRGEAAAPAKAESAKPADANPYMKEAHQDEMIETYVFDVMDFASDELTKITMQEKNRKLRKSDPFLSHAATWREIYEEFRKDPTTLAPEARNKLLGILTRTTRELIHTHPELTKLPGYKDNILKLEAIEAHYEGTNNNYYQNVVNALKERIVGANLADQAHVDEYVKRLDPAKLAIVISALEPVIKADAGRNPHAGESSKVEKVIRALAGREIINGQEEILLMGLNRADSLTTLQQNFANQLGLDDKHLKILGDTNKFLKKNLESFARHILRTKAGDPLDPKFVEALGDKITRLKPEDLAQMEKSGFISLIHLLAVMQVATMIFPVTEITGDDTKGRGE